MYNAGSVIILEVSFVEVTFPLLPAHCMRYPILGFRPTLVRGHSNISRVTMVVDRLWGAQTIVKKLCAAALGRENDQASREFVRKHGTVWC